ncbi:MAG TPA: heme lyase CcmF/NrfE family subunit [Steroidobacteraceae bacterium]|nr:heme lyase CcmF/NrfE family subunit [Steroidobacteraceae bacterium]
MLIEIGHFAMILALLLSAAQAFFGLAGAALKRERWLAVVPSAVAGQFLFLALGTATLVHAFVVNDFSVKYVAEHSNSALPLFYRISALWGAHEGSLLLWICVLGLWTVAVALRSDHLPRAYAARVLGVLGVVSFGFLLFLLSTSSPFERLFPAAVDGNDLNPLLQDFAMAIHPPILYTGYVGMSVSFAFACAAMLEGRTDNAWARWQRPWTIVAWAFLSCGIALGSWWAYYELGWGGWWFWDPVENASFMPWLVGTALIHSLAVTDKRGLFKSWTLLLSVGVFSLSLLGTFLVRSGVLVSVHSFASDPARGIFILSFLALMIGGALTLFAWRAPKLGSSAGFAMVSRESFLLFNNILLVVAAAVVFGGTLAPLIADTLHLGTLSVGPPYFNPSFLVPTLPLVMLVSIGIHSRWRRGALGESKRRILGALATAVLVGLSVTYGFYGGASLLTPIGAVVGFWIILSSLIDPIDRLRRQLTLPASVLGMTIAHIGLGCFVLGITFVKSNTIELDVALARGASHQVGDYVFRYNGGENIEGPNFDGFRGHVTAFRNGKVVAEMSPEKRHYFVQGSVMTEAAIAAKWNRDLLAALGEDVGNDSWSLRLQYRPMIRFIWLGAAIMALGGITTLFDRRYRFAAMVESGTQVKP